MKVFGLTGWSGSGKTTLMVTLLPLLVDAGLQVSTLKHAHHAFDIDKPGKDSYRHRGAGASEVMIASRKRWALMHELRDQAEPTPDDLIARMQPVDLLLIEGFKTYPHDKLEVYRPSVGSEPLYPKDPTVVAVASDQPGLGRLNGRPLFNLADSHSIARFILDHCGFAGDEPAAAGRS